MVDPFHTLFGIAALYGNFDDIISGHFSRICQLYTAPHATRAVVCALLSAHTC